jgi:hypothetical protein
MVAGSGTATEMPARAGAAEPTKTKAATIKRSMYLILEYTSVDGCKFHA